MRIFDTKVQDLKYQVLREVARHAFEGRLKDALYDIPLEIVKGPEATMRCCIYKERAIPPGYGRRSGTYQCHSGAPNRL